LKSFGTTKGDDYVISLLRKLWANDDGQDIAEYAMMLTVILLIVAATVSSIGTNANTIFGNTANKLTTG
jgi:Flp pilus assembly pilin Flp